MSDIGKKIYERRKQLGLTLEEVGEAVGVGKSTVLKWENGTIKNMGIDKAEALAKVLQMNPVEFVPSDNEWEEEFRRAYYEKYGAPEDTSPRTREARIISAGIDNMSEERRKAAIQILQLAFSEFSEYLKEDQNDDT